MNLTKIEIDVDVYKVIESNRINFTETANQILRRIFNLESDNTPKTENKYWESKGVKFPEGSFFRLIYNDQKIYGKVENGFFTVNHKKFNTFSEAASYYARTKENKPANLNGWAVWEVKRPQDKDWIIVKTLRKIK